MERSHRFLKKHYYWGGGAALVIVLVSLYGILFTGKKEEKIHKASVVKVMRQNLSQEVTFYAELRPFRITTLYAKVPGYMRVIHNDIGDRVKEGDIIAILEVPEIKADLERNKARYDMAKLDYDRLNTVHRKRPDLIAQDDIDKAFEVYHVAKANYEHTQTLMDYSIIKAPFDGIVTMRYVDEGALIQQGLNSSTQAKPVVDVAEDTKLRLCFPVNESFVQNINVGDEADLTIQATGKTMKGRVARYEGKVDHATRTMNTEIDVDNRAHFVKPGMYATATLKLQRKDNVLSIPIQAINLSHAPSVFLITQDKKTEKRSVKTGMQTAEYVEIINGLKEGDLVVYGNLDTFKDGMRVEPKLIKELPHAHSTKGPS